MHSDVGNGWAIKKIKSSLNHYHISMNHFGYTYFKVCTITRRPTPVGLFIIKYGNVYNAITKDQLKNMKYVVKCIKDLVC